MVRIRAALRREVRPNDFRFGESAAVPAQVSMPNRNYMNLLELPMLFYVVCLILFVTAGANRPRGRGRLGCTWGCASCTA